MWYPHIANKLSAVWGTQQFYTYINSIILMDRSHRMGFNEEAYEELVVIQLVHMQLYPDQTPVDPWTINSGLIR